MSAAYRRAGVMVPSEDAGVAEVMTGIAKHVGTAVDKMTPLVLDDLTTILERSAEPPADVVRDHLVLLLLHEGMGAADLHALDWGHLTWTSRSVTVAERVRQRRPNVPARTISTKTEVRLCPVRAFAAWRDLHGGRPTGPVFPQILKGERRLDPGGMPLAMPYQSYTAIVRGRAAGAGLSVAATGLPKLTVKQLRVVVAHLHQPRSIDVRDRALLTIQWMAALRRSNVAGLYHPPDAAEDADDAVYGTQGPGGILWQHITQHHQGLELFLPRSKTDQEGKGRTSHLPRRHGSITCPEAAFLAWRDAFAVAAGCAADAIPGHWPVFCRIDRHGNVRWEDDPEVPGAKRPIMLRPDGVHQMVGERAADAGLVGRYGSHSLRRGFATEAVEQNVALVYIQKHVGWASLDMLTEYTDVRDAWANNAAAHIADAHRAKRAS